MVARGDDEELAEPEPDERASEDRRLTERLLEEVGRRPRLAWVEERELARAVRSGLEASARLRAVDDPDRRGRLAQLVQRGAEAKHELVAAHLPLAVTTAERYAFTEVPFLDLFQAGSLGLFEAAERFDWYGWEPFATVATWWIRRAVCREARSSASGATTEDPSTAALDRAFAEADLDALIAATRALPPREREVLLRRQGLDGGPVEDVETVARRLGIAVAEVTSAEARAVDALARAATSVG
jgi:RNA polymerase sigma factor (sigma-70 family)